MGDSAKEALQKTAQDRIISKLVEKGGPDPTCPICHTHEFDVGAFATIPTGYSLSPMTMTKSYPAITLLCHRCGAMLFVNLLLLGFTEAELKELMIVEQSDAGPA